MPATYTYNDALDDAGREVARVLNHSTADLELRVKLLTEICGSIAKLRRSSRRRTAPVME